jgi:hypothetical protein
MVQSGNVTPIFVLNRVVFEFFFGSYCLIATVLNRATKKINRAQSGSSHFNNRMTYLLYIQLNLTTPTNGERKFKYFSAGPYTYFFNHAHLRLL